MKTPEVFYCPKCKKYVLEADKELIVGDPNAAPVCFICKTELVKRAFSPPPSDCYD